jgi:hypothetical protein
MGSSGQRPATSIGTSTFLAAPLSTAPLAVRHAFEGEPEERERPALERASCPRCGDPVPVATPSGRPRRGARFCSATCRLSAVADRRAAARADLLDALTQLAEVEGRIQRALSVLGLNPKRPRARRGRR